MPLTQHIRTLHVMYEPRYIRKPHDKQLPQEVTLQALIHKNSDQKIFGDYRNLQEDVLRIQQVPQIFDNHEHLFSLTYTLRDNDHSRLTHNLTDYSSSGTPKGRSSSSFRPSSHIVSTLFSRNLLLFLAGFTLHICQRTYKPVLYNKSYTFFSLCFTTFISNAPT